MNKAMLALGFAAAHAAYAGDATWAEPAATDVAGMDAASLDPGPSRMATFPVVGPKRVLLVIGRWSNGVGPDVSKVRQQVFSSDPRSLRSFVRASSNGKLELNEYRTLVADFGPRPVGNCQTGDMRARAAKAIAAAGIPSSAYDDHHIVVSCQGGANAVVLGRTSLFFGVGGSSHAWLHEYGHNLGVSHPSTYVDCRQSGNTVYAPAGCAVSQYGDSGDPVGGGSGLYPAITRAFAGWLDDSQFAEITRSGLYALSPLGKPGPNLYTIRVPGNSRYMTLEYRQPNAPYDFGDSDNRSKGLWIRYSQVRGSIVSTQLNANPGDRSRNAPTLVPGKTLVDTQSGVSITTCSASAGGVVFAVAMDGKPLPACGAAPSPSVVTVPVAGQVVSKTPVVAGTGVPGAMVTVVRSHQPGNVLGMTQVDADGRWQVLLERPLPEGSYSVSSRQTLAGRVSSWGNNRAFVATTQSMTTPRIATPAVGATTSRYPVVSGVALPGASMHLVKSHDPGKTYGRTVADAQGRWSIKVVEPLPAGRASVSVRQTLAGRTSSWSSNQSFNVSHSTSSPVIGLPLQNAQVKRKDIVVSGQAAPGAGVVVVRQGNPQDVLGSAVADANGAWSAHLSPDLPLGRLGVSSRTWDNGLMSSWSANRVFTVTE